MNKLIINGKEVPESDVDDLSKIEIEYTSNTNERTSNATSITLKGATAQFILDEVVDKRGNVKALVKRTCCKDDRTILNGSISWRDVDWCANRCTVSVQIVSESKEDAATACIHNKLVSTDAPFENTTFHRYPHPFVRYCDDPRPASVRYLIISLGLLILFAMAALLPIYLAIGAIISAIKAVVSFDPSAAFSSIEEWYNNMFELMNNILASLSGCGNGHHSPFVRDYLKNVCNQCGIQLSNDTIFTNPASEAVNTVYFHAPIQEGRVEYSQVGRDRYFSINAPLATGKAFLDSICGLIKHEWYVEGDTLYIRQETAPKTLWYDAINRPELLTSLCFEASTESVPAIEEFSYVTDSVDSVGDEARFLYNDLVDYNNPFDPALDGLQTNEFLFGAARFRGDQISPDVLEGYDSIISLLGGVLNALDFNPKPIIETDIDDLLLLQKGKCLNPKLLILRSGAANQSNAKAVRKGSRFNSFYWFDFESYDAVRYANPPNSEKRNETPNLAQFWIPFDPRNSIRRGFNFTMEVKNDCDLYTQLLDIIDERGVSVAVRFMFRGESVTANVDTIQMKGTTFEIAGTL